MLKGNFIIPKMFVWIFIGLGLLFLVVAVTRQVTADRPIYSCTQAHAQGIYAIQKGDKNYRPQLDRDHDGVACE
jgi:hypothetical protein